MQPRTLRTGFLPVLLFMGCTHLFAQPQSYKPVKQDSMALVSIMKNFEVKYKSALSTLPAENKSSMKDFYQARWDYAKTLFTEKEIFLDKAAQEYLDALVGEIRKANPVLQQRDFSVFFDRTPVPNASYLCHGLIVFNMGLFTRLHNESQVAFILCHELSHFYLEHGEKAMRQLASNYESKEFKDKLKQISKQEYGKRTELEGLLKGVVINTRRHSRDHEAQADSMAFQFLKNTRFNTGESLQALGLLDSIDKDHFTASEDLPRIFNTSSYPFQPKWLRKETGLLSGHAELETEDKALADSLKTHPDCKVRIALLAPFIGGSTGAVNPVNEKTFRELQSAFRYEMIQFEQEKENLGATLYLAMLAERDQPGDPYLVSTIGSILTQFYVAQKEHRLGLLVSMPSPYYDKGYNEYLQFIQNLHKEDYIQIAHYFLERYQPALASDPMFSKAYEYNNKFFTKL